MPRKPRRHGGKGGSGRRQRPVACQRSPALWLGTPSTGLGRNALAPTSKCVCIYIYMYVYIYIYIYVIKKNKKILYIYVCVCTFAHTTRETNEPNAVTWNI